ncbi:hypothetical protein FACS189499_02170 [Clostridia bacterium]|nr:hypothetical protein FACS189499_02170 [Clostridia bacterium]
MKRYALLGHPLGHSLSPFIHERLFRLDGLDENQAEYFLLDADEEKFRNAVGELKKLDGFNITIPYKTRIMEHCRFVDETAEICGAVNCYHDGIGYNTDVIGFLKTVHGMGAKLSGDVLLLGCGGAGRMIAGEIIRDGGNLTIVDEMNKDLPDKYRECCTTYSELYRAPRTFSLVINATPVGMFPKTDESPLDFSGIETPFALDIIYNPAETRFLREAKDSGAKTSNGLSMLVLQAAAAHEKIWKLRETPYSAEELQVIIEETAKQIAAII